MAKEKPMIHGELIDWSLRQLHDALLRGGAKEMRAELFTVLHVHADWLDETRQNHK